MLDNITLGDLIIDKYIKVSVKENQEVDSGLKGIKYQDSKRHASKYLLGGAGNYFKHLNLKNSKYISLAAPDCIRTILIEPDYSAIKKMIYYKNIDSKLVPIKSRFISIRNNKIVFRYDEEYLRKTIPTSTIKNLIVKQDDTKSVSLIDYDKYFFKNKSGANIKSILNRFVNDFKVLQIMPKPENYRNFVDFLNLLDLDNRKVFIFCNEYEYSTILKYNNFIYTRENVYHIVTYGKNGIEIIKNEDDSEFIKNEFASDFHNTSGAGDVFAASFLKAFISSNMSENEIKGAIKYAFKFTYEYLTKLNKGEMWK